MNASFEEKSAWIQLVSLVVVLGGYFVTAAQMLAQGITVVMAYAGVFIGSVVMLVIVLVVGHTVVAIFGGSEKRDERDKLIEWRAEGHSSWILAAGVFIAVTGLVLSFENVWIANLLIFSLLLSEVAKLVLQIVYYRRGF